MSETDESGATAEVHIRTEISRNGSCDLQGMDNPDPIAMRSWGADRTITADALHELAARKTGGSITLRGAVIAGTLDLAQFREVNLMLDWCRVDRLGATATELSQPITLRFCLVMHECQFKSTRFVGNVALAFTLFMDKVSFRECDFVEGVDFTSAAFGDESDFTGSSFESSLNFHSVVARVLKFSNCSFKGRLAFDRIRVALGIELDHAKIEGSVSCQGAVVESWTLADSEISATELGAIRARSVSLDRAQLVSRLRLSVMADVVSAQSLVATKGVHLSARSESINLHGADFGRGSIVSRLADVTEVVNRFGPPPNPFFHQIDEAGEHVFATVTHFWLANRQAAYPTAFIPSDIARIVSLEESVAGDCTLFEIDLRSCKFFGAYGLDHIRIVSCRFRSARERPSVAGTVSRDAGRRMIVEEVQWRKNHVNKWRWSDSPLVQRWGRYGEYHAVEHGSVSALQVAHVYRALRKSLEDSKNEPEAADFYYGEMEMRRLDGRSALAHSQFTERPSRLSFRLRIWLLRSLGMLPKDKNWFAASPEPVRRVALRGVGKLLLTAYWSVSGYGLKSLRSFAAYACCVLVGALLIAKIGFTPAAKTEATAFVPTGYVQSVLFSVRETLSALLRLAPPAASTLTTVGLTVDVVLRIVGPALIALGLLAVRSQLRR